MLLFRSFGLFFLFVFGLFLRFRLFRLLFKTQSLFGLPCRPPQFRRIGERRRYERLDKRCAFCLASMSTTTAPMLSSPLAIVNGRGLPSINSFRIGSHFLPRQEFHGPVMPASDRNASPCGNIRASFVGICVCVPTIA